MKKTLLYLRTIILSLAIATTSVVALSGCVGAAIAAAAAAGDAGAYEFGQHFELKKRDNNGEKANSKAEKST